MKTCNAVFIAKYDDAAICRKEKGHIGGHIGDPVPVDLVAKNAALTAALENLKELAVRVVCDIQQHHGASECKSKELFSDLECRATELLLGGIDIARSALDAAKKARE